MTLAQPAETPATPLATAEAYAALGWRVIPIAPGHKYPKGFPEWQRHATDNLDIVATASEDGETVVIDLASMTSICGGEIFPIEPAVAADWAQHLSVGCSS